MKKITWYYICTFGIGYLVAKKKAKKIATTVNSELTVTNEVPFKVKEIIDAVGGVDNYLFNTTTINSIKIGVKDIELVDKEKIKKMGAVGVNLNQDSIRCLFGDFSKKLGQMLDESYPDKKAEAEK